MEDREWGRSAVPVLVVVASPKSRAVCFGLSRFSASPPRKMALFFFSGTLIYVTVLLTNAVAILSEDRFLARSEQRIRCLRVRS